LPKDTICLTDPETQEPIIVPYDELDPEIYPQLWRPIGGFCYEVDNFVRLPLPEVPFYVKDWLPKQGKMEIYGQAKAGKSFLSIQLARSVGSGEDFIGIPTTQGKALYLQFELGEEVLQGRIKRTGRDYDNVYVGTSFAMKLDTLQGQDYFNNAMHAIKPQVVILDPFVKIFSGDENDAKDVKVVTDFLDDTIGNFNCSVVIIHHAGKDLERGGRGSSLLEGWVDSYIEMKRVSKPNEPELKIKLTPKLLRHAELPPKPIDLRLAKDFEFEFTEGAVLVIDKVKSCLMRGKATGGELIAQGLGHRKSTYDALKRLQEQGLIRKDGLTYEWIGEK